MIELMRFKHFLAVVVVSGTAFGQYPGWKNTGSLFLNTTPDGANLPATASEEGFPVLVRLHKDFFNFAEAKPNGEDVRFSRRGSAAGVSDRAVGCGEGDGEHLGAGAEDRGQCAAGNQDALGQGGRGE